MRVVDIVVGVAWAAFWVGWLAAAFLAKKSDRTHWRRSAGIRLVIFVVIVVAERIPAFRGNDQQHPSLEGIGLTLFGLGLAVAVWARVHLGRNWGAPMSEKHDPQLVTTGPYRWIRNPIYSGLILAMIGTALAVSLLWFPVAVVVGGFFVYSALIEQRYMTKQFPDTYPVYRSSTKMLIPYVF